jgi:hypothetical protein
VLRVNDGDPRGGLAVEGEGENDHGCVNSRYQSTPFGQSHQFTPYTGNSRSVLGNVDDIEAGREGGEMPGVGSGSRLDGGSLEMGLLVRIDLDLERIDTQISMRRMGRLG